MALVTGYPTGITSPAAAGLAAEPSSPCHDGPWHRHLRGSPGASRPFGGTPLRLLGGPRCDERAAPEGSPPPVRSGKLGGLEHEISSAQDSADRFLPGPPSVVHLRR